MDTPVLVHLNQMWKQTNAANTNVLNKGYRKSCLTMRFPDPSTFRQWILMALKFRAGLKFRLVVAS
jgi:hypothetical protein